MTRWIFPKVILELEFPEVDAIPQFLDLRFHFKDILPDGHVSLEVKSINPNDSSEYFYPEIKIIYNE